jgi:hypothetical protein
MTRLNELINANEYEALARTSIHVGDVYRIEMNRDNGIIPKAGASSRNKFFIVLGFDADGVAYGGVIINSRINQQVSNSIKDWHMPISCAKYSFLDHDSFVDCSTLKSVSLSTFSKWEFLGEVLQEDVELIIETVKSSPNETPAHLKMFGLIADIL